jgi:hypothetical protein
MAFQAPFEISQTQLRGLRLSSVDSREVIGAIYPFFGDAGATLFLVIDTSGPKQGSPEGLWMVDEFPLEIRKGKAIYPRPIVSYRPLAEVDPAALAGRYHFDPERFLAAHPSLPEATIGALDACNIALRARGKESVRDLFFTLDLRRVTGAVSRSSLLLRRRLEIAALRGFLRDTTPR